MKTIIRALSATTIMKTASWMAVSATIVFCIVLYETGSFNAAFWSALVAASLKTPAYTAHEWVWNWALGHHVVHLPEGTVDEEEVVLEEIAA